MGDRKQKQDGHTVLHEAAKGVRKEVVIQNRSEQRNTPFQALILRQ
jgi:hypothetical protein